MPSDREAAADSARPDGAQPLHAWLRERLRADILDGRLPPEARLPSETELTRRFGISRITVRQALAALAQDGLIVSAQGKGRFVAPRRIAQDLARLQGLSESVSGQGRTVHGRTLHWREARATAAEAVALGLATGDPVLELLSLRYVDRQPLSLNRSRMAPALAERLRRIDVARRDLIDVYERELGIAVGHADLTIAATAADARQARLLAVDPGAPLLRLHRVLHAADGRPLHLETAVYRSDAFNYSVRVERARASR